MSALPGATLIVVCCVGGSMAYWSNILAMAGAACIAVAFINGSVYVLLCGLAFSYAGYKLWRVKK